jgi:Zn ribbon nucleic-acid-binding protein
LPLCPDCYADGKLELMVNIGEEKFKGKDYVILECISCGSSVRERKKSK